MKDGSIVNISNFKDIYKINLLNIPNQTFSTTIANIPYNITIETSLSLYSYITIKERDLTICNNGNIKNLVDLTLTYPKGSFFFLVDIDKTHIRLNYSNFNKGLNLYYGVI